MKQKGFTLAEIMIVLTVIGILTAVLLPTAIHSTPDENVMKFKKANATLYRVISELVNSDQYYLDGDLGVKPNGEIVDSATYFCETFADVVSTKSVNCSDYKYSNPYSAYTRLDIKGGIQNVKNYADIACKNVKNAGEEIITTDGIVFYQTSPGHHFGWRFDLGGCYENVRYYGGIIDSTVMACLRSQPGWNDNDESSQYWIKHEGKYINSDENSFDRIYKVFCIDIDGINKGEDPFGYGIRADGKILTGKRADEWLKKSIQNKD